MLVRQRQELVANGARLWTFAENLQHKHDNLKELAAWRLRQLNT
jgi:hypothetical protein